MRKNKNEPALGFAAGLSKEEDVFVAGLTKREYFAAMAMKGILANQVLTRELPMFGSEIDLISEKSVILADTILTELEKPQQ